MDLLEVLKLYRKDVWAGRVRLVRHADYRWDLEVLLRSGHFDEYQARQGRPVFKKAARIVSFVAERGTRSRFLGVFRVRGVSTKVPAYPPGFPYPHMGLGKLRYDLAKLPEFAPMENRLVIDWGAGTRSWVQKPRPKPVIEILPTGHVRDFPGYDEVILRFEELERIVRNPDANRTWHTMLRAVAGVYLITDMESGAQYVGSAHGDTAILGRWTSYVKTKDGGNKRLKELLSKHPDRYKSFVFSILRTLPRSMTKNEVIAVETLHKKKLGTRAFGLNEN